MDLLKKLDTYSVYNFGIFHEKVSDSDNYIRFKDDNYIKTNDSLNCSLQIFCCIENRTNELMIKETCIKILPNISYYIQPRINIDETKFKVNNYHILQYVKYLHIKERINPIYEQIISHIGIEKVLLKSWPFENVKLKSFLEYCNNHIQYKILLCSKKPKKFYEYDKDIKIEVDDYYSLKMYKRVNLEYNAIIFNRLGKQLKKIITVYRKQMRYNGSSLTSDTDDEFQETERVVIIFNPQTLTRDNTINILGKDDEEESDTTDSDSEDSNTWKFHLI